jgi:hypothetical protein
MASLPAPRVIYSVIFFVLSMILIIVAKPHVLFDPETGAPRPFGFSPKSDATLFSLGVVVVSAAIASMYLFAFIDLVWGSSPVFGPSHIQQQQQQYDNLSAIPTIMRSSNPVFLSDAYQNTHPFTGAYVPEYNFVPALDRRASGMAFS